MKDAVLKSINTVISVICIAFYIILLVGLFITGWYRFIWAVAVPAAGFVLCTVLRIVINAPRPYEAEGVENAFGRVTIGKSFPSRHVFSIFVISTTILVYEPVYGAVLLALGVVLAVVRVMARVHYTKDVIAGALMGIGVGSLLYLPIFH